jgi:phage shock protein E
MHRIVSCALVALACAGRIAAGAEPAALQNPAIDSAAYLRVVNAAIAHRATHRLTEDEFIALSALPGTVVLDARSSERYQALHVQGAVNLPFPDITAASLAALIPDPDTRVLIYCNNNFRNAPDPFPAKLPSAALNLSTYTALYDYGYRNVYELGPMLDVDTTRLEFAPPVPWERIIRPGSSRRG